MPADPPPPDGRQARRERNRGAVIDAMFALLEEGRLPPTVEEVSERSGVSMSSVFRYFDGLDDLHQQTIDRYFERFSPLFELPPPPDSSPAARIDSFVTARLDLYESIAPIARMARVLAPKHQRIARTLHATRSSLHRQIRDHFGPDLAGVGRAQADDRVALVDAVTSFESWDLLHTDHERSRRRIARAWTTGLAALLG